MESDRVILRKWHNKKTDTWELEAFLPDADVNPGHVMCYAHIGQHSEADFGYYQITQPADENTPEAQALIAELKSIGYNVRLTKRLTRPFGGWAK
jgi:hypothetical protein